MGGRVSAPSEEEAAQLRNNLQEACVAAAQRILDAEVLVFRHLPELGPINSFAIKSMRIQ